MTLQDLEKQVLELSASDRWKLVRSVLASLENETQAMVKRGNLLRLRGIAKNRTEAPETDPKAAYVDYLTEKYQ
ncbi:hypothetical protein [Vacuolonema iberomarrocanum]|uniref:hypothetical protein n=1 Tax=Vacuolonema iberomarrocanum TaxID=3454632 RepID=UPI0019E32AC2|nr:hypothetical protein [filamentous cyanobacterium LEGE 07170]